MTRENARLKLVDMGVAEPTEEQITKYLDSITDETKKEKDRADRMKADAEKAKELQAELDRINNEKLSDVERITKELETANQTIAQLQMEQAISKQKSNVVEKFKVTAEQANQIVKDDGSLDLDVLGQIISEKETAAANAKEQELANNAGNPGGGAGGESGGELSKGAEMAQRYNESNFIKV